MLADVEREMEQNHSRAVAFRLSRSQPSPPRYTAKEKGKGRAIPGQVEVAAGEDENNNNDGDGGAHSKEARYTPGPLSEEGVNEALELGKQTIDAFKALGKKYGKSSQTMMVTSGLAIQHARQGKNLSNMFKQWYAKTRTGPSCKWSFIVCLI